MVGAQGLELRRLFDHGLGRGSLGIGTWRTCVGLSGALRSTHLVHALLDHLADSAQAAPALWEQLLDATLGAMRDGQVGLIQLGREVRWLEQARPHGTALRPVAQLAWGLARLSVDNHLGHTGGPEAFEELAALSAQLLEEAPQVSALADLHLAVTHTNRLEFERATESLAAWLGRPAAVGGRRAHAQIRSSLGQHAAFLRDFPRADSHFQAALAGFAALSDPREAAPELARTRAYRAIAVMDDPGRSDREALAAVLEATGLAPEVAEVGLEAPGTVAWLRDLARTAETAGQAPWQAHVVLRLAAGRRPMAEGLRAALADCLDVPPPTGALGFPWHLITLYRALILRLTEAPPAVVATAAARTRETTGQAAGPTLTLISWAIEAALLPPGGRTQHRGHGRPEDPAPHGRAGHGHAARMAAPRRRGSAGPP
jgi:hypothetical protein